MLRFFAIFFLGLVLTMVGGPSEASAGVTALADVEPPGADCCPDRDGAGEDSEGSDCCDPDFGCSCAPAVVALAPTGLVFQGRRPASSYDHHQVPPQLLRPQTTGPPPTPPPIA